MNRKFKVWIHIEEVVDPDGQDEDYREVDVEWAESFETDSERKAYAMAEKAHKYLQGYTEVIP